MGLQRTSALLAALPAFANVPPMLRRRMATEMRVEVVDRRSTLVLQVPPSTHYLLPLTDNLTLHREGDVAFGLRLPVGVLWPVHLRADETVAVRCLEDGVVGVFSSQLVASWMRVSAESRTALLQSMCQSRSYAINQLEQYACNDLTGRMARLLLELYESNGGMAIRCSHARLAELLNVQRESVSVIIGRFRRAGWIETGYGRIHLTDLRALQRPALHY